MSDDSRPSVIAVAIVVFNRKALLSRDGAVTEVLITKEAIGRISGVGAEG